MDSSAQHLNPQALPALIRSFRRGNRRQARAEAIEAAIASRQDSEPPPRDPGRAHAKLEDLTADFRLAIAREHFAVARTLATAQDDSRRNARADWNASTERAACWNLRHKKGDPWAPCSCVWCVQRSLTSSQNWHLSRATGQIERFDHVRACGTRTIKVTCLACHGEQRAIPDMCRVRRACTTCGDRNGRRRRRRFAAARERQIIAGARYGLDRKLRKGGRFTEKMLTLTVPHVELEETTGKVRETSQNTLQARVQAAFLAWRPFSKALRRLWKTREDNGESGLEHVAFHRAFEWTPGKQDEHGHPHFHVYVNSPWVSAELLQWLWADALRAVGCPVAETSIHRVKRGALVRIDDTIAYRSRDVPGGLPASARPRGTVYARVIEWQDDDRKTCLVKIDDPRYPYTRTVQHVSRASIIPPPEVRTDLRMLRAFDVRALAELTKSKNAVKLDRLSRIEFADGRKSPLMRGYLKGSEPGIDAFDYAEGWSLADVDECAPEVIARLYMALEKHRLTQASRSFFVEDPRPECCECHAAGHFAVSFVPREPDEHPHEPQRGKPCHQHQHNEEP